MKNRTNRIFFIFLSLTLFLSHCKEKVDDESLYTGDLFRENIRSTEPRTPEEELLGFKLPPGFEIQLFASEPDIDKPINMTFDAKGRLWVTQSFEYPFPTGHGKKSTDRLTILEDTDHDGKADRFTKVLDTLNIPIGVLPVLNDLFAFSIPNVYHFIDADGDGKHESKKTILGPFGFQDTHGMVSNFIRGYDGWIHACHGFTNYSKVAGTDGDSITLISGNTFRFRLDGSRIEQMTYGQVNPFGLAYDEKGYIYSTDSHSSPLYQLIRGGDYPHFGKPEIMAFVPDMKPFENEATALAGIAYYHDVQFPKEFQGNFFVGGPLVSKVHRYSWIENGSSPVGKAETDFIKSADPWFRPVNIKLGPDGALYVADFYNAIIGHYEVPLDHPKRDKQRGRIWRITYKGNQNKVADLTTASITELLRALDLDNITSRMLAADQLADRIGEPSIAPLKSVLDIPGTSPRKYIHALWILYRLNALNDDLLKKAIVHNMPLVRLHTLRILREWKSGQATFHPLILDCLKDKDPHVQRAAVELLMDFPDMTSVEAALGILHTAPVTDTHLIYTSRLALRNLLRNNTLMKAVGTRKWSEQDAGFIAGTLVDVNSEEGALFLSDYMNTYPFPKEKISLAYQQITRFLPASLLENGIVQARDKADTDMDLNVAIFKGIKDGLAQRGGNAGMQWIEPWGTKLAKDLLEKYPVDFAPVTGDIVKQQNFGLQLAGEFKVKSLSDDLKIFLEKNPNDDLKISALRSIFKLAKDGEATGLVSKILMSDSSAMILKKRVVYLLDEFPGPATNKLLSEIKKVPADLEILIVGVLATSSEGKDIVLKQVRNGFFLARTLLHPRIEERMLANISPRQRKEYEYLISAVEPLDVERQSLIEKRLAAFKSFSPSQAQLDSGAIIFATHCSTCHQRDGQEGIGPQLLGIGKRGAEGIAEKILDPNRNIVEAFRNYSITLKDGKVMTGLFRQEQGAVLIFGDLSGKEFSVPRKDIAEQKPSRYTIMPDQFGTTLSQKEFNMLLAYLLTW